MPGHLLARKWENCMSIDRKSWGYRREAPLGDYLTIEQLITVRRSHPLMGFNPLWCRCLGLGGTRRVVNVQHVVHSEIHKVRDSWFLKYLSNG